MISLNMIVEIESGSRQKGGAVSSGIPSIGGEQIDEKGKIRFDKMKYVSEEHFQGMKKGVLKIGDTLVVKDGATTGKTGFFAHHLQASVNEHVFILRAKEAVHPYYLYSIIKSDVFQKSLIPFIKGIIGGISLEIRELQIPLPPLQVQKEIVAEIEGYQKVIDGARAVVDHYRPHIPIDPDWLMVALGDVCDIFNGSTPSRKKTEYWKNGTVPWFTVDDIRRNGRIIRKTIQLTTKKALEETSLSLLPRSTVLVCCTASVGECAFAEIELTTNQQFNGLVVKDGINADFLVYILKDKVQSFKKTGRGSTIQGVPLKDNCQKYKSPLPSPVVQHSNPSLPKSKPSKPLWLSLPGFDRDDLKGKIRKTIGRVWGDDSF